MAVIAIAGVPGSGKSTVAAALAQALGDASVIPMDAYERMTRQSMAQLADWAARGADLDQLSVPWLDDHLAALKAGQEVTAPTGHRIAPARFIVFETQFGRAHRATGRHIDLLVWLDTPREIALARTVRRLLGDALTADPSQLQARTQWLAGYLDNYVGLVQKLVAQQRDRVLPGADLVVDGAAPLPALVEELRGQVARRFGAAM